MSLYWLYDRTHEAWLLELARKIQAQGYDWRRHFDEFRLTTKTPSNKVDLASHGVNTGMGLKQPGVRFRQSGDPKDRDAINTMLGLLDRYHGQATGIFTCDEHLAGRSPSQGTELCTVVEAMYSLEVLAAITGQAGARRSARAARVQCAAGNVQARHVRPPVRPANEPGRLQAGTRARLCQQWRGRQYLRAGTELRLLHGEYASGWPKFVENLWMRTSDGGLAAIAYAPSRVETRLGGKPVVITLATDYPFDDTLRFTIEAPERVSFPLKLRIPAWTAHRPT